MCLWKACLPSLTSSDSLCTTLLTADFASLSDSSLWEAHPSNARLATVSCAATLAHFSSTCASFCSLPRPSSSSLTPADRMHSRCGPYAASFRELSLSTIAERSFRSIPHFGSYCELYPNWASYLQSFALSVRLSFWHGTRSPVGSPCLSSYMVWTIGWLRGCDPMHVIASSAKNLVSWTFGYYVTCFATCLTFASSICWWVFMDLVASRPRSQATRCSWPSGAEPRVRHPFAK